MPLDLRPYPAKNCGPGYHAHPLSWSSYWYTPYGWGAKSTKYGWPTGYWGGCSTPTGYVVAPMQPRQWVNPYLPALEDRAYNAAVSYTEPIHMRRLGAGVGRSFGRPYYKAYPSLEYIDRYEENPYLDDNINEEPGQYIPFGRFH